LRVVFGLSRTILLYQDDQRTYLQRAR